MSDHRHFTRSKRVTVMSLVFFLCLFLLKLQSRSEGLRHFVFQVRKMQFKLTLFPLDNVGCYKSTLLGGMGKNLVKAVFMSVFCRLASKPPASNSIQKHLKKKRCPKTFWPGFYLPERGGAIFPRTVYSGMSLSLLKTEDFYKFGCVVRKTAVEVF